MMAYCARIDDPAYRAAGLAERPLGWVELQQAFGPRGKDGTWLRKHDAVVKVGDTLFVHGGISPRYATVPAADINARVRASLASKSPFADLLMTDGDGPLWYRGLNAPEAELSAHVDALLAFHGVARIVVGHTTAPGVVLPRFGGKVILNDVGCCRSTAGRPRRCRSRVGRCRSAIAARSFRCRRRTTSGPISPRPPA